MGFKSSIAFIGGGNMAEALAGGIVRAGILPAEAVTVSEPQEARREHLEKRFGFRVTADNLEAARSGGTVFLAVKPQVMEQVLGELSGSLRPEQLIISIAAGVKIETLEKYLPGIAVIRSMPNTPALVGCGATVISAGHEAHQDMAHWAVELFHSVGECHVLPEKLMDAVTGLSGSGPAYIFRMAEALTEAGVAVGIPAQEAAELVKQTILGAARMMTEREDPPSRLRKMVTSPGGTTQAGLEVMDQGGFMELIEETVKAATYRARELGKR